MAGSVWRRALALLAVIAVSSVAAVAQPAYAAGNHGKEIVNGGEWGGQLRADVIWASTAPYTGVFLWPNNQSASQEFDLLDSGNGFFRIRARHSNQCLMLDWRAGSYANGTPIIQYPYCDAGYTPAEWSTRWLRTPDGPIWAGERFQVLVNRRTGRCLDAAAPNGRPAQQARLQQWDCITSGNQWNTRNQMWIIQDATDLPIIR